MACTIHGTTIRRVDSIVLAARQQLRDSIVVSISACHAEDPGSIPGRGICCACIAAPIDVDSTQTWLVELWDPARGFVLLARWLEPRPHGREHDCVHAFAPPDGGSRKQKVGPALASNMEDGRSSHVDRI